MAAINSAALSDIRILAAYVIFLASYVVFALGKFPGLKIDRTGAAIIGAVGIVAFRIVRPGQAPFPEGQAGTGRPIARSRPAAGTARASEPDCT
jgi:hypothetical protein